MPLLVVPYKNVTYKRSSVLSISPHYYRAARLIFHKFYKVIILVVPPVSLDSSQLQ